jgi:hypothetical protein
MKEVKSIIFYLAGGNMLAGRGDHGFRVIPIQHANFHNATALVSGNKRVQKRMSAIP